MLNVNAMIDINHSGMSNAEMSLCTSNAFNQNPTVLLIEHLAKADQLAICLETTELYTRLHSNGLSRLDSEIPCADPPLSDAFSDCWSDELSDASTTDMRARRHGRRAPIKKHKNSCLSDATLKAMNRQYDSKRTELKNSLTIPPSLNLHPLITNTSRDAICDELASKVYKNMPKEREGKGAAARYKYLRLVDFMAYICSLEKKEKPFMRASWHRQTPHAIPVTRNAARAVFEKESFRCHG